MRQDIFGTIAIAKNSSEACLKCAYVPNDNICDYCIQYNYSNEYYLHVLRVREAPKMIQNKEGEKDGI